MRRSRRLLTAFGVLGAALVLGVALTVVQGLATGFDRAADEADLASVVARFDEQPRERVAARVGALPNLAAASYRYEETRVPLRARGRRTGDGVVQLVDDEPRRGYAIVAGRDLRRSSAPGAEEEVVVERGLADEWGLEVGDRLRVGRGGGRRVVGIAVGPDNVAYPLAPTARVYLSLGAFERRVSERFGRAVRFPVNEALLWTADEDRTDVLLSQARQTAAGVRGLRFVTREGVQAIVSQSAGLVVGLLVAFGVVAAGLAGVLLGAGAQSDVQRRLPSIGVRRAVGLRPAGVVRGHALEGAQAAALPAAAGLALGAVVAGGPTASVLHSLNQLEAPVAERLPLLAAAWLAVVVLVAAASALPAWRAARRPVATLLRGGDVATPRGPGRAGLRGGRGVVGLGARLVAARRARYAVVVGVLGAAAAVALLLLALASLLTALRDDPATLGKRYQLTANLDPSFAPDVERLDGVAAAAPRFQVDAVGAGALGSPLRLIAYPGDHTRFEAPPLAEGRRVRGDGEAEVGAGLADVLGLRVGSTLAVQPQSTQEVRFRVVGIVRALQDEGRVAFVRPGRLEAVLGELGGPIAVRLEPGADRARVTRELAALGARAAPVGGATGDDRAFLGVLAALLRVVAGSVGLVVLFALVQTLALTARERRGAVATLRAAGADRRALTRLLGGAALAVVLPAAALAVLLEAAVLSPVVASLAAGYADLPLGASLPQALAVAGGLAVLAAAAGTLTARRLEREPVVAGLREEAG
ncbi:ABC transporter permease [Conexibacter sp. SYSU D00693]|uniref:ABC transporter permease n=1 Tax=Conexibacter sp. SYSU D00693 TaxID=2812560 RepID=UPI00196B6C43|nr:ABC transporter permease [Conexibacter sp. SYSU D00693]